MRSFSLLGLALTIDRGVVETTGNHKISGISMLQRKKVVYVYRLINGNLYVGFTERSILERTHEHVNYPDISQQFAIKELVGLYCLKDDIPPGENVRSFEAKLHYSLAESLGVNVKTISESGHKGFKCSDGFIFLNSLLCLEDLKYYERMSPLDLRSINGELSAYGLLSF